MTRDIVLDTAQDFTPAFDFWAKCAVHLLGARRHVWFLIKAGGHFAGSGCPVRAFPHCVALHAAPLNASLHEQCLNLCEGRLERYEQEVEFIPAQRREAGLFARRGDCPAYALGASCRR